MNLNPNKTSFGRNETFNLRYSWLNKGLKEFNNNKDVFSAKEAPLILGVGKNMVNSIKYWLNAYQVIDATQGSFEQTDFGKKLDKYDPYLDRVDGVYGRASAGGIPRPYPHLTGPGPRIPYASPQWIL